MTQARYLLWLLALWALSGCHAFERLGKPADQTHTSEESSHAEGKRGGRDKDDVSFRLHGSTTPELFPAELIAQHRPQPDFKKEDIRPVGGRGPGSTPPVTEGPPVFPLSPPPLPFEGTVKKTARESQEPVVEALHCILQGRHTDALAYLRKYDPATQEIFLRLLPAIAQLSTKSLDRLTPAEVAVLHEQLQTLVTSLRPRTELTIDKICFCDLIKGYGEYRPLPEGHAFQAATATRPGDGVQLYVELRNVASELRGEYFETRLVTLIEIQDTRGGPKIPMRFDEKEPFRTRTLLNDFFNVYRFHMPPLPPGTYHLTIQIADETRPESRRVARKSLEFRIAPVTRP